MTNYTTLDDKLNALPVERKNAIQERADHKIEGYKNLQEIRTMAGLTQVQMSKELAMTQGNLSRLEKSTDAYLSTLKKYVSGAGGKLSIIVELPGKPPVPLSGLGDLIDESQADSQFS